MTFNQDEEFEKRLEECTKWKPTYRRGFPYSLVPEITPMSAADEAFLDLLLAELEE